MRRCNNPFLQELAGGFHAAIGAGNLFVAYYNARKGNTGRAVLHLAIAAYEAKCFDEHWKERQRCGGEP